MTSTKERILVAAVTLFNLHGAGKISTNHIAAEAGMSPGNLYYHFKNKEEIIRAILEKMHAQWTPVWEAPEVGRATLEELRNRLLINFQMQWDYRFFYREALALLQADEELRQRHTSLMEGRMREQEAFAGAFVRDGALCLTIGQSQIRHLLTACWIVVNNWLSFLEMNGTEVTALQFGEGVELVWSMLAPFLAGSGIPKEVQGL